MATKKYWKGLSELNNNPEFVQKANSEFAEQLPVEKFLDDKNLENDGTNRRDFLKFLGFSVTAASLAACETPVNKAIPYVVKPEEITPGVANWYASTYYDGNDYASIIVKTREGRPIKIEGNELSKVTMGGTNARVQASVLSLYDSSRLNGPQANGNSTTWAAADKEIGNKLSAVAAKGGAIRILSSTIISPSTKAVIADFTAKYPSTKHITYDAVSYSGIAKANAQTFGQEIIPSYNFDKAEVIVGIAADFLANWLSPIESANQYGKTRKVGKDKKKMSKHYQFESNLSLTGANADYREPVKVSEQGKVAVNLYNAVAKIVGGSSLSSSALACDATIAKAAQDLTANKGKSVVVCGSNDVNVQLVVNGINQMLDNYGKTIDLENANYTHQGDDTAFAGLVADMAAGKVDVLITYNTNPVYTAPASLKFAEAYNKVGLRISFADRTDETASLAHYICPDHNYLESWNDFMPKRSHFSLSQPTISPLFSTRQAQETLLKWSGNNTDYHTYMQKVWMERVFPMQGKHMMFADFWNYSLHDGAVEVGKGSEMETGKTAADSSLAIIALVGAEIEKSKETNKEEKTEDTKPVTKINLSEAASKIAAVKGGEFELAIYEKVAIGNGNQANNPWLQELPDPITKITWDNYVTMSPLDMEGKYELMERQDREASVVNVTVNGATIKLPVVPQPGQARGTIGIAVGYGREKAGNLSMRTGNVIGQNAYPFVQIANGTMMYGALDVKVDSANETTELAGTQIHHTLMGRDIVKETVLSEYQKNPKSGNHDEMLVTHSGKVKAADVDLWDSFDRPGHKWGMTIDLNSCIGCGACVVGCTAENNVAVVGKDQVMKTREMHWLRIDRYYTTKWPNEGREAKEKAHKDGVGAIDMYLDMENPDAVNPKVVFQPMLCQHCNHAPCENVCPVLATNHSNDGLNQMTYNRCVGTRYCANNCPYKVRRFNWFNYNANPDFTFNPTQDDLGRMVLNPDVVVRSRGVMEKCSMCVQRIQEGKLDAKKAERKIKDGEIKTACQQACPTNAIIFGDLNDEEAAVTKLRKEDERNYYVLEEIGTKPTLSYLTKVRNCEEAEFAGEHEAVKEHKEA
ncbi:MAG: molybdopterin oxidoreductase [Bacteroidetes bacterium]|jgi:molybdopterin-containing oxidoreductase family iron-sulfur binding subunit|nr:molybdopterin oxidoreductase [Bacteroidota bacterium]